MGNETNETPMRAKYREWIDALILQDFGGDPRRAYGKCQEVSIKMAAVFPELSIVRGHAHTIAWGKRGHWWLVDGAGMIVDPTAGQFPGGVSFYEEYKEGDPIRSGSCMDCGEPIWDLPEAPHRTFCNEKCADLFAKSYMEGVYDDA